MPYQMKNGLIVVEVEDLGKTPLKGWVHETNEADFKGSGFYRWDGPNNYKLDGAGKGAIKYQFVVKEAGTYYLSLRAQRDGGAGDQNNDLFMRVDGKAFGPNGTTQPWTKMFFSGPANKWNWSTKLDYKNDTKADAKFFLGVGTHTIEFSGRSNGFHFDRFHLNKGAFNNDPGAPSTKSTGASPDPDPEPGVNTPPVAGDDVIGTSKGKPITIDVLGNDTDANGDVLSSPALISEPTNGIALRTADKKLLYIPDSSFVGTDQFTYEVSDGKGGKDQAAVTVNVGAAAGKPVLGTNDADQLNGTAAGETLTGFDGDDTIQGNDGNDLLFGWADQDTLMGGAGNDVLFGGQDADILIGGLGADLFVLAGDPAVDVIKDFSSAAGDRVVLRMPVLMNEDGSLDASQVKLVNQGVNLSIQIDPESDGTFRSIATIENGANLTAGQVLANAITDAIA